jgi:hypothetical protein
MTRAFTRTALIGGLLATTVGLAGASAFAQDKWPGFDTYRNDKHGFSLTYSTTEFQALPQATPDGFQAVSKDGKARLLVGTIANFDGKSLAEYRTFILNASYPGAKLDYAPVRDTWFVVSGVKADGTTAFYQRVNFVCGGRFVNSWAVLFPYDEEYVYSNIIEQVHKNYRLGSGNCGRVSMMQQPATPTPKQMGALDLTVQSKQMAAMDPTVPKQMPAAEPATPPKPMAAAEPATPPKPTAAAEPATPPRPMVAPKQMAAMEPAASPQRMAALPPTMQPKQTGDTGTGSLVAYSNDKHGFTLNYPASQFLALPAATPDGFQAVSRDGKARLQAGTIANFDGKSLGAYRNFLLAEAYPGAKLDDAPALNNGFVISGVTSDGVTGFYQRVSFACGGSNINSLAVIYPAAEKPAYAPIIDQVSKDYSLGDGNCGRMTMVQPK